MQYDLIGTDLAFPVVIQDNGDAQLASGSDLLAQSVQDILATPLGSLPDNPYYGSKLDSLLFEPNTDIVESLLDSYIAEALARWERRLTYEQTTFDYLADQPDVVVCRIQVVNRATGQREIFTYPFYREL